MARSRTLKPSFFTSDQVASCTPLARLLFAGLWTIADRAGKLRDRPRKIKAELLPYEPAPDADLWLAELALAGLVLRYEGTDGERYLKILGFEKHQNPHPKEPTSEIPEPCISATSREKNSTSPAVSCFPIPVSPLPTTEAAARLAGVTTRLAKELGQPRIGLGDIGRRDELEASVNRVVELAGEDLAVETMARLVRENLGGNISAMTALIGWLDRVPDREWRRARNAQ